MEKFKKSIHRRVAIMRAYSAVIALFFILSTIFNITDYETKAVSFILGACLGIMLLILIHIRKYTMAIKYDEGMRKLYIEENDERHKFILSKTGGHAIDIVVCGLALGAIISGFFNEVVFFTLLGATIYTALVKGCLKIYYSKKV